MFIDDTNKIYAHKVKIRACANLLAQTEIDDDIVEKLGIYPHNTSQSEITPLIRHVINMLYTIRAETEFVGQDFIDVVIGSVIHTLKTRELTELEEDVCFAVADVFVGLYNLY